MLSVLAALETLHAQAEAVFDGVDAACGRAEAQLEALEARLTQAAARVEASCGSTRPLVVHSARSFGDIGGGRERALGGAALGALAAAAPLPADGAGGAAPALWAAVEGLARAAQCAATEAPLAARGAAGAAAQRPGAAGGQLLAPGGRLTSTPELFLFNSREQPYRSRRGSDSLAAPCCEEEEPALASGGAAAMQRRGGEGVALNLDDDESDPLLEDLRFRPARAAEVAFDLPDSLPDLGGPVADIMWRQQDQAVAEMERPAWDAPVEVFRQMNSSGSRPAAPRPAGRPAPASGGSGPAHPAPALAPPGPGGHRPGADASPESPFQPPPRLPASSKPPGGGKGPSPPPTVPGGKAGASPAPDVATAVRSAAPPPPPPPPPPVKGKGEGKGKGKAPGKGQAPKPPPPKPKAADAKPPPQTMPPGAKAVNKAAMFADISKGGAKLRKVGAPKERSGALVGRVVG